jgi:hypothetical protein
MMTAIGSAIGGILMGKLGRRVLQIGLATEAAGLAAVALDFSRPTALILTAILHFIPDDAGPHDIVARLVGSLPEGSYLALSHATNDFLSREEVTDILSGRQGSFHARSEAEFTRFFEGAELVPPGIVSVAEWRAHSEPKPRPTAAEACTYCAVARVR